MLVVEPARTMRDVAERGGARSATFDEVYAAERAPVVRLAYLLVRSQAVAEELAQEAFTVLFLHFDEVDVPAAYLRTAVVRLALRWTDRHRMEGQRLQLVGAPAPTSAPDVDEMWQAIGRLRPERQTVLVLRFYEDLSHDDIARLVGCSAGTVRSRVRRALADLRRQLPHSDPEEHHR
jgi:RNA polymerase sigma factor (sigma-70 family)